MVGDLSVIDPSIILNEVNRYKERYIKTCDTIKVLMNDNQPTEQMINTAETYLDIIAVLETRLEEVMDNEQGS